MDSSFLLKLSALGWRLRYDLRDTVTERFFECVKSAWRNGGKVYATGCVEGVISAVSFSNVRVEAVTM